MRLPVKLSLLFACATTGPLLLAAAFTLPVCRATLGARFERLYQDDARALAAEVQRTLAGKLGLLALAGSALPPEGEAQDRALLAISQRLGGAEAVGLFDQSGNPVSPPRHFAPGKSEEQLASAPLDPASLSAFVLNLPGILDKGAAVGPVYVLPDAEGKPMARVVLAVPLAPRAGKPRSLAAELSLGQLSRLFEEFRPAEAGQVFLLDSDNKVILHPDPELIERQASLAELPILRGEPSSEWLGALAEVPLSGWKAVVQVPVAEALGPVSRLLRDLLLWIALGLAASFALGFLVVRKVTGPVESLREAALQLASGALETTATVPGKDELAELAEAFQAMSAGLLEREELKMTLALRSTEELDQVLQRLFSSLGRTVRFERAAALILSGQKQQVRAVSGSFTLEEAQDLLEKHEPVQRALQSGQPELSAARDHLALPLRTRGEVIGIVGLESAEPYAEGAVRTAAGLAQQAAIAVDNARLFEEVQHLATQDAPTSTLNRRHLLDLGAHQLSSARRFDLPLAVILLDVDRLRSVNEKHGSAVGDQVLRAVAERCGKTLRSIDLLGRYGGGKFAFILPGTGKGAALSVLAERLRRLVEELPVPTEAGPVAVTVSLGVAGLEDGATDLAGLFAVAESSLREAQRSAGPLTA